MITVDRRTKSNKSIARRWALGVTVLAVVATSAAPALGVDGASRTAAVASTTSHHHHKFGKFSVKPNGEPRYRAKTFSPAVEAKDYSNVLERQAIYDTPSYQKKLRLIGAKNNEAAIEEEANDPQREFSSDLCYNGMDGCAGDVRLYNWEKKDYGIVRPILFTARDGAQLSGHVWATKNGPAKRPGIVITDGSVQADEQMYWYAAQALAKDGYIVMTFDPQGQGQSDTFGQGKDKMEGVPAQTDGRPFFDGTEDAIDFFLSNPKKPYEPVASCNSGTSHAAYQNSRVKAGFDNAYNPFWRMLKPSELGIAGHSYGAAAVSYIGQWDPRVKAIVAWDNLAKPNPNAGIDGMSGAAEKGCVDKADRSVPTVHTPALGMSVDYELPPEPNTSLPKYNSKDKESFAYTRHHVDTGQIVIRGGSHLDYSWIPNNGFPASKRGPDLISWYTDAWFDRYVKRGHHERKLAYRRLVTRRWRHDKGEAKVDSYHDGNAFSYYYRSRLDIHRPGGHRRHSMFNCENLRRGCKGMTNHDGYHGRWSYLKVDKTRQGPATHSDVPRGTGIYPKTARTP